MPNSSGARPPGRAAPAGWPRCWARWRPGYAQALQDRTRAEQEQITAAAFAARVAAEQARWNSEARLEAVFAESVIGIAVAEIDGTILEVNRALCDMLGFTAAEITGRTVLGVRPPRRRPGLLGTGRGPAGRRDEPPSGGEALLPQGRRARSGPTWCSPWSGIRDGHPRYVVAMIENITERYHLQTRSARTRPCTTR